jgi:hypothetical protein|tara:strand:+ start:53 stop:550 length:498 start_codon:yes stop_codon:yes gene_type:complete
MATQDQIEKLALKLLSMGEKRSISEILGRNMSKKIDDMPIKELRSKVMAKIGMNQGGMSKKKKGMAKGGVNMKKKGYAAGGLKAPSTNQTGLKKLPESVRNKMGYMNKGGMPKKKKGYAMGGANMKKKAYAKGGTVATYNVGGMVKSSGPLNTGIKKAPDTYNKD